MAGYHERLRDLKNTRWLMRDFLICGFRTRNDQKLSSARTYDDERHRIESLLGDSLQWRQTEGGRQYFISAEAAALPGNPLHRIWRLRTFTDNDLMLHCCLLAELDTETPMTVDELTDAIWEDTELPVDVQSVRRKLQEYAALGLVREEKDGKRRIYTLSDRTLTRLFSDDEGLEEALSFFREAMPLGSLADGMMLRGAYENEFIRFKQHFLMHTLDDAVLLRLLEHMHARQAVQLTCDAQRADAEPYTVRLLPVCVRVSEMTGRRYLVGYDMDRRAPRTLRLDLIQDMELIDPPEETDSAMTQVRDALNGCWGIALPPEPQLHRLEMDIRVELPREAFVVDRLQREGRGGRVTRIEWNLFRYETEVTDTMEMMAWIRSFTGRIVALRDSSGVVDRRFREDMERLRAMYATEVDADGAV